MAHRPLIATLLLLLGGFAHAGYAELAPPPSWTSPTPANPSPMYRPAANDLTFGTAGRNTVLTNTTLNVGGRATTVPAAMRFAANAGQFAARSLWLNPVVLTGLGAAFALSWLADQFYWDDVLKKWMKKTVEITSNTEYRRQNSTLPWRSTLDEACKDLPPNQLGQTWTYLSAQFDPATCYYNVKTNGSTGTGSTSQIDVSTRPKPCPSGYTAVANGCQSTGARPATQTEFEETLAPQPFPHQLPTHLPDPLPVELPRINPRPAPDGLPSPMRVPLGEPIPVPNTNPQRYIKPAADVKPANNPSSPWRVDVQPVNVEDEDPNPLPDPDTALDPDPATDPDVKPREPGLCEQFPDILACAKLDTPDSPDLPSKAIDLAITPDGGWGSGSASCPAPRQLRAGGVEFSFQLVCDWANLMRPLIVAFAWLASAAMLLGIKGGD